MEGNQQKMREALDLIADEAEVIEAYFKRENAPQYLITSVSNIINLAREYRSIPLRQCDVGTPEEQEARYKMMGEVYHTLTLTNALAWAQTPYEAEEGAGK